MTKDDIERMWKVASNNPHHDSNWFDPVVIKFAQLVAIAEREAMMQLFTDPENQPTQHGTVTVEYMQREIAAEREACAKVCDGYDNGRHANMAVICADAIRERGQ